MALDGIFLNHIKNELTPCIVGARVEKIHQPSREELVIHLRSKSGAYKLFLSVRVNSPRINLTSYAPENPATPPMFCMLLRKKLTNAILKDIRQPGLDRVLYLDFDATNEIGDRVILTLSIEIMAKHSNIILTDENGRITDAIKRIDFSRSAIRQILPGFPYTPPPAQDKPDFLNISANDMLMSIKQNEQKNLSSAILSSAQGFSPIVCRELAFKSGGDIIRVCDLSERQEMLLYSEIKLLQSTAQNCTGEPYIVTDADGVPTDFSFMKIEQYGESRSCKKCNSFSQLLDNFYYEKDRAERTRQKGRDLVKFLHSATERSAKKLDLRRAELEACADRDQMRICAELINANLYSLQKGSLYYDLPNYYDNNNILRIKADPALTPAANAQKYFKKYRKAKTAEQMLTGLIEKGEEELQYLESVSDALERSSSQSEIDEIRNELVLSGFLKPKAKDKKKLKPSAPLQYITSDGFRVLVGKNNIQNDRLTFKTAQKNDMWLHTQKIHGSHVIIQSDNREISDDAIVEAAEIAAYHSKAREAKLVPVDYTLVKNLKKPPSSPPGKVIYHVYYSVNVSPNREKIEKMQVKK